jgi:hypothetical protein
VNEAYFLTLRAAFHAGLFDKALSIDRNGVWSNADKDSRLSREIAQGIAMRLKAEVSAATKLAGQTLGNDFERAVNVFIRAAFLKLGHLRPGNWEVLPAAEIEAGQKRAKAALAIFQYEQYAHLYALDEIASENREVAVALGNTYIIRPDIVVARYPEPDAEINSGAALVDPEIAKRAAIRLANNQRPLLHASISCKWTLRSDRAQNARTEALNLIRNRKGRVPHIIVVTAEPLPSRLASLALGTGDVDCIYHFALPELDAAVAALEREEDAKRMLDILIEGRRLKDIADLPLDLAV